MQLLHTHLGCQQLQLRMVYCLTADCLTIESGLAQRPLLQQQLLASTLHHVPDLIRYYCAARAKVPAVQDKSTSSAGYSVADCGGAGRRFHHKTVELKVPVHSEAA